MSNETFPWPRTARPDYAGMRVVTVVPPSVEPVTVAEAKSWGVISTPDDDADVASLIAAVREGVEARLGQALITQTKTVYFSGFPSAQGAIRLPYPPLQSVSSLQYSDMTGNSITFDASNYHYTAGATPGAIRLPFGQFWPLAMAWDDAVQITYVCGYGDTAASVPMRIRMYIRARISAYYRLRESDMLIQGGQVMGSPLWDDLLDSAWHGEYR